MFYVENLVYHHFGPVSFRIEAGESVVLSGPSGAGKSLMLRAIADLDCQHSVDEIRLFELDGKVAPPQIWRRSLGMLPAHAQWWAPTVGAHFLSPNIALLEKLHLPKDAFEWDVTRLSAGEGQRLALLRVLDRQPRALFLDEPTANLDPHSVAAVETFIVELAKEKGLPLLWISHTPGQSERIADRTLYLEKGKLVEEGLSHASL